MFVKPLPNAVTFSSWVLVDATRPDLQRQCTSLLEALGTDPHIFDLRLRPFLSWTPRSLWGKWCFKGAHSRFLSPPWPDFVLGAGSLGTVAAGLIKRLSKGQTFSGCLGQPKMSTSFFDFVVSTLPDALSGDQVISSHGALSSLTAQKLYKASQSWADRIELLPHPRITFLMGSAPTRTKPRRAFLLNAAEKLKRLALETGGGLLAILPQETSPAVALEFEKYFQTIPHLFWKSTLDGNPPYHAFLGAADYLIVTGDSFPLVADALATEVPLYLYPPFSASPEYPLFSQHFVQLGLARPFEGNLQFWSRPPFSETQMVAADLLKRFLNRC